MSELVFGWRYGSRFTKLDPQAVGNTLESLREEFGELTAELVLVEARAKDSPLHRGFEWNNTRAAELHRLETARSILRSIVLVRDDKEPVRQYVVVSRSDEADEEVHNAYVSVTEALADPEMREQVLRRALKEVEVVRKKYSVLRDFADAIAAVVTKFKPRKPRKPRKR